MNGDIRDETAHLSDDVVGRDLLLLVEAIDLPDGDEDGDRAARVSVVGMFRDENGDYADEAETVDELTYVAALLRGAAGMVDRSLAEYAEEHG